MGCINSLLKQHLKNITIGQYENNYLKDYWSSFFFFISWILFLMFLFIKISVASKLNDSFFFFFSNCNSLPDQICINKDRTYQKTKN